MGQPKIIGFLLSLLSFSASYGSSFISVKPPIKICHAESIKDLEVLIYEVKLVEKYTLVVRSKMNPNLQIYTEQMGFRDWQGVGEYHGRSTRIVDGELDEGFVEFKTRAPKLEAFFNVDKLKCD